MVTFLLRMFCSPYRVFPNHRYSSAALMHFPLLCHNRGYLRVRIPSTITTSALLLGSFRARHSSSTAASLLVGAAHARMSKKSTFLSSTSSTSSLHNNAQKNKNKKKDDALPTERQKTLNRFLGLPLEQRQTRVDSLFRKQANSVPVAAAATAARSFSAAAAASGSRQVMEIDASSDVEEINTVSKANGKKRRVVASSDEESDDGAVTVSSKAATQPSSTSQSLNGNGKGKEKAKAKSPKPANGVAEKPKSEDKQEESMNGDSHVDKKSKKEEGTSKAKAAPKIASIFAAPPKKTSSSSKPDSSALDKKKVDKGKSKADDVEEDDASATKDAKSKAAATTANSDEGGEISGVDENGNEEADDSAMESEEEQEQAAKLAEIFTKKVAGSSKGKYGKGIDWKDGEPVPYAALAEVFERIDSTTKRLEIAAYLTTFLTSVIERTPGDLTKVIYLCINRIAPDYEGIELGIGEGMLKKAIALATGVNAKHIDAEYKKAGDLGLVAMNSRATQATLFKPKPLTVNHVFNKLREIAKTTGASSQNKKVGSINGLLAACQGQEAKFIVRSCEGKLRIGLAEQTVLGSLAHATVYARHAKEGKKANMSSERIAKELEDASRTLKTVFSECPNYDLVIPPLLEGGTELLREKIRITPGIPLKPMLAKPTKAISEVLDRFEGKKFTCEYKYDGERAQVHYSNGKLSVFSRNSEDMSVKYPDLIEHMQKCIKPNTESFVLDAEAVAWDKDENKILPFQELSKRKRKDVKAEDIKVKVHIFAFDLLYLNGESLLKKDLDQRRQLLREHFTPVEGQFAFAKSRDIYAVEEIQAFLDESIKDSCEGLMVKMMEGEDATYEPSRRSMNWLKLKKDYLAGVGDSFDLVVIGGYHGRGKRTSVYGAFLLACYDPESETYQAITKIGTGFSEEMLENHYNFLKPLEISQKKAYFDLGEAKPDVFFEPKVVWEVLAADLSLSPVYTAAKGLIESRGISLRFPRFIRIRDDKDPDDASNAEFVAEAYQRQVVASGGGGKGKKKGGGGGDEGGGDGFW